MSSILLAAYGIEYSVGSRNILHQVSFELAAGQFTALLGPNGSGKSTLMKWVAGILPLQSRGSQGQVRYLGQDFKKFSTTRKAQSVVYVGSELSAEFPMTAEEVVLMGRHCRKLGFLGFFTEEDRTQVRSAMEACLCWHLRDRSIASLSGGEKQLVSLARAFSQGARVLFLDESLSQMDLNHQILIGKVLKEWTSRGMAILLISHDVNLATAWADHAIFLKQGRKIGEGPIHEMITSERLEMLYPGAKLNVDRNPQTSAPKIYF